MKENISLLETIRESFGRVVYTHKAHEVMGDRLASKAKILSVIEIILIAITASGITIAIDVDHIVLRIVAAILSFLTLALSLYKFNLNSDATIISHRTVANELWMIRERYINLICDLTEKRIDESVAIDRRDRLQKELKVLFGGSPQISPKAYTVAQERLQKKEDFTFTNEELNKFLPSSLSIGVKK